MVSRLFLVLACVLLNGIVLINAIAHDPNIGPDAGEHLKYARTLSEFRLPYFIDSEEYFSPPLPYMIPAIIMRSFSLDMWHAAKWAQLVNVLLSVGITYYLLKISEQISPGNISLKLAAISFLMLFTVYYKTFAQVRSEPYVAFFAILVFYEAIRVFVNGKLKLGPAIALGIVMGLLALSRQWGLPLFPALIFFTVILMVKNAGKRMRYLKAVSVSLMISLCVSFWFYGWLFLRFGTFVPFLITPSPRFSFTNQPAQFYQGLGDGKLFTDPVRPNFPNQLIPVFYSDAWGDHKAYFSVYGKDIRTGEKISGNDLEALLRQNPPPSFLETNRFSIAGYLGRVNLLAVFPTVFVIAGFVLGIAALRRCIFIKTVTDGTKIIALGTLIVGFSLAGYMWFLIMYPDGKEGGQTIKATYMIHIFPFLALLSGYVLHEVKRKSSALYYLVLLLFLGVFIHSIPVFITRYVSW